MALDIFFGLIFLFSVFWGIRTGLLTAVFRTCGWLIAIICGFIFNSYSCSLLLEHTNIYTNVRESIYQRFSNSLPFPDEFSLLIKKSADSAITATANAVYSVICFGITITAVIILLFIILHIFSKKHTGGLLGFADGLFGGIVGALRGVILVFIASVLLIPVVSLTSPELSDTFAKSLDNSYFALHIYQNNPFTEILSNISNMHISSLLSR